MTVTSPARWHEQRRHPWKNRTRPHGPVVIFLTLLALGGVAWLYATATLPADAMLPAIGAVFAAGAVVIALTWPRVPPETPGFTYWDAAGLLLLVGVCAAAAVEPDQVLRLMEANRQP